MTRSDVVVRPEHFVRYLRNQLHVPARKTHLPTSGVLVFGGDDLESVSKAIRADPVPWTSWIRVGRIGKREVAVARAPIGAPATIIAMEEIAALGVRRILTFGACGSLRKDVRVGRVVLPTFAISDEGTSRHYARVRRPQPDSALRKLLASSLTWRGIPFVEGGMWTTDAPYRETRARIREVGRQGAVAVDMEASAVFAVARARGWRAAGLMVVSDELGGEGWNPGFHDPRFVAGKQSVLRVLLDVLAGRVA